MIYLDNAATTFPKPKNVYKAVDSLLRKYCANPGRSGHDMAMRCAEEIYDTREAIASYFSLRGPERVCFVSSATEALNTAIKGAIKEKCQVIISDLEHNSVLRPLYKLREKFGIDISVFDSSKPLKQAIDEVITDSARFIVTTLRSNVIGCGPDITELSDIARSRGLRLIADGSQLAGHKKIQLSQTDIEIFCTSGHKGLFGIPGTGLILFNKDAYIDTLKEGGTGGDSSLPYSPEHLPDRFEAGTQNVPGIISLKKGIEFLKRFKEGELEALGENLNSKLMDILSSQKGLTLYGCNGGIASFNIKGYQSSEVGYELNKSQIYVRCGLHCAPLIHRKLGTDERGAVRVSLSVFNTYNDIDRLYKALKSLI